MTERFPRPTTEASAGTFAEGAALTMSDRTRRVDRCFHLLADRRRRFCLYHLQRAERPLAIRELARSVEAAVTPPESSLTDPVLDEAVLKLHHVHLPKLRDAGLVDVRDGRVELSSTPPVPVQEWLGLTARAELEHVSVRDGP